MGGGDPSTEKSSEMQELFRAGKDMNMLGSTHNSVFAFCHVGLGDYLFVYIVDYLLLEAC